MTARRITEAHLIDSVADALQYISYYHPPDFIRAMAQAYEREQSAAARNAIRQILVNSRMAAIGHRPICQDTGAVERLSRGRRPGPARLDARAPGHDRRRNAAGLRLGSNPLRTSIVVDPLGTRRNTKTTRRPWCRRTRRGADVSVIVSAKGGGSENKAKFAVLNPSASVTDWVVATVAKLGAGWCPPGMIGLGVGGSVDKAMVMAKASLNDPIDIRPSARGAATASRKCGWRPLQRLNALGIGAQGLGGLTTALDVKMATFRRTRPQCPLR